MKRGWDSTTTPRPLQNDPFQPVSWGGWCAPSRNPGKRACDVLCAGRPPEGPGGRAAPFLQCSGRWSSPYLLPRGLDEGRSWFVLGERPVPSDGRVSAKDAGLRVSRHELSDGEESVIADDGGMCRSTETVSSIGSLNLMEPFRGDQPVTVDFRRWIIPSPS